MQPSLFLGRAWPTTDLPALLHTPEHTAQPWPSKSRLWLTLNSNARAIVGLPFIESHSAQVKPVRAEPVALSAGSRSPRSVVCQQPCFPGSRVSVSILWYCPSPSESVPRDSALAHKHTHTHTHIHKTTRLLRRTEHSSREKSVGGGSVDYLLFVLQMPGYATRADTRLPRSNTGSIPNVPCTPPALSQRLGIFACPRSSKLGATNPSLSLSRNLRPQKSLLKFLSLNLSDPTPPSPNHIPRGRPYFDLGPATTGSQRPSLPHSCVCPSTRQPGCPRAHESPNLPLLLATAGRSLPQARLRTSHNHFVTRSRFRTRSTICTARPILKARPHVLLLPSARQRQSASVNTAVDLTASASNLHGITSHVTLRFRLAVSHRSSKYSNSVAVSFLPHYLSAFLG